ncbi:MAG: hypothetical protein KAS07_05925, partial [Candidatus Pacebacteria bacterium]|nr:hypothetical protein [Candidatus Paceibacterota bacterium]
MSISPKSWNLGDWNAAIGDEREHLYPEDIRKMIWLINHALGATDEKGAYPAGNWGSTNTGYWADGPFRADANEIFFDNGSTNDDIDYINGPGEMSCWFNDEFSGTPYNIVGATQDHDGNGWHEVWILSEDIGGVIEGSGGSNTTVKDDLRAETPLKLIDFTKDLPIELEGYWRIKSAREITDGDDKYVLMRLETLENEPVELVLGDDYGDGLGTDYTDTYGGQAGCEFGGDWYTFCPFTAGTVEFVTDQTITHEYANNARGPLDKRPPTGGIYSSDRNIWWIRTVNPYRYHHYDDN